MRDLQTKAEGVCGCQKGREMGWLCFGLLAHLLHISVFRFLYPWILSYVVVSWCVCVVCWLGGAGSWFGRRV